MLNFIPSKLRTFHSRIFEKMERLKTSWIMWALSLAVLSVSALQVTGLKSALDLRGQNFNQSVERSLNQMAEWIQVSADINFLDQTQIIESA